VLGKGVVQDLVKKQAKRSILIQILLLVSLGLLSWIFISTQAAYSAVLGGLSTVLPAIVFMLCAFAHHGAHRAAQIVGDFYLGSFLKWVSMGLLFYVFFSFCHLNGFMFMLGFIMTQILALIAPSLLSRYERRAA
jgi:F0F1-type ATP synthase assembly protein I